MSEEVVLDGSSLTLEALREVATQRPYVRLSPEARRAVDASRAVIEAAVRENRVVYGVTTGFGRFADVVIPVEALEELQMNLVRSHAAGV
ncbi:MAG TPA: aromatic amino acid lyase, partial [Thermoanaerobaculia bacterium]|nr:aromatic amino acid lyase [Thermoanaerobaculia bacterium]